MSPSNSSGDDDSVENGGLNYIEHQVSKMDTLAGIAIKYGVEVADIKRMNGLGTDLQMFALKTLQIPLPGRHPPSSSLTNGSATPGESNVVKRTSQPDIWDSLPTSRLKAPTQKVSPAMGTLQQYYGLKSPKVKGVVEGTEMAVFRIDNSSNVNDRLLLKVSPISNSPLGHGPKSMNFTDGVLHENGAVPVCISLELGDGEIEKSDEKSVRRRQKAEVDCGTGASERLLKGENTLSASTGKGSGMRPKSASRPAPALLSDPEPGWINTTPLGFGDSKINDATAGVHKSLSTSSLRDHDNNISIYVRPTIKWSLKPDLQALSTAAITIPIFDGLPNSITGRRNKAAID